MDPGTLLAIATATSSGLLAATAAAFLIQRREAVRARARLHDIVEALPNGFVFWDADDRLAAYNAEFGRVYDRAGAAIQPGARFADIFRACAEAGQFAVTGRELVAFIEREITAHRRGHQTIERQMSDGRWFLITERRTRTGGIVGIRSDITALKRTQAALAEANARAEHLARHDALTGLPNRAYFDAILAEVCARSRADGHSIALLALDLDGFKSINDTLGHAAGDALLRQVADRLRQTVGVAGTAARLGGDEFAIVIPGRTEREAEDVAAQIVATLGRPYDLEGRAVDTIGVSVGLAFAAHLDADALSCLADDACYAAKRAGRRTWRRSAELAEAA